MGEQAVVAGPDVEARKRWTRRTGYVVVLLGLMLALGCGWLLWWMLPTLLHPGEEINGTSFTGSEKMAKNVIALLGGVVAFGAVACVAGAWQIRTGERNLKLVGALVAIVVVLWVVGKMVTG
jgi:hypothetical protein